MAKREEKAREISEKKTGGRLTGRREKETAGAVIRVQICSVENGLEEYEQVSFIRIKSRRYTLLIMREFMPVIGEIEGDVTISAKGQEIVKKGVRGYFLHQHNQFSLMLQGYMEAEPERDTEEEYAAE